MLKRTRRFRPLPWIIWLIAAGVTAISVTPEPSATIEGAVMCFALIGAAIAAVQSVRFARSPEGRAARLQAAERREKRNKSPLNARGRTKPRPRAGGRHTRLASSMSYPLRTSRTSLNLTRTCGSPSVRLVTTGMNRIPARTRRTPSTGTSALRFRANRAEAEPRCPGPQLTTTTVARRCRAGSA